MSADENNAATPAEQIHLDLENFLPYRLSVLSNLISSAIALQYAERYAMGRTEWRVLAVIGPSPGLIASEVVERTAMDKVAVSRAVDRLVKSGRISREEDPADRRRACLKLTSAGRHVYSEVVPLALALEQQLLSSLGTEDRSDLHRLLNLLAEAARKL